VVADSLVSSSKAVSAHTHFNKRVVECRLAAALIAENLGLLDRGHRDGSEGEEGQGFRTIRQLEEALQDHPKGR
jgi:galactokinase